MRRRMAGVLNLPAAACSSNARCTRAWNSSRQQRVSAASAVMAASLRGLGRAIRITRSGNTSCPSMPNSQWSAMSSSVLRSMT